MILTLGVTLELGTVKVDFAQICCGVALGFVVEVRRGRMAALASDRHRPGAHFVSKFDYRDEAVAARAVPLFRSGIRPRAERGQRAPERIRKSNRNAWRGIVEGLDDVARQAL